MVLHTATSPRALLNPRLAAIAALTAVGLCSGFSAAPTNAAPARAERLRTSLCNAGETALMQCATGVKQVAVCASKGSGGGVQYRFGAPDKVELVYPADMTHGTGTMKWASTGYSGGGEMQIQFRNGEVTYLVYSRMVRTGFGPDGHNNPQDSLGVTVQRGGKTISELRCKPQRMQGGADDWIDEARTRAVLPEGEFIYSD